MSSPTSAHPTGPRWFLEAVNSPYDRAQVEVEGCPINYLRWGDTRKPGVVLIHGGAAHAHWWAFIAPQLAKNHHVVALDSPVRRPDPESEEGSRGKAFRNPKTYRARRTRSCRRWGAASRCSAPSTAS